MTVHSHFTICMTIMEETSSSSSVSSTAAPALPRDEVKEVQHNSRHDTRRIRWWRMVVAGDDWYDGRRRDRRYLRLFGPPRDGKL